MSKAKKFTDRRLERAMRATLEIREACANAERALTAVDNGLVHLQRLSQNLSTVREALPSDATLATLQTVKLDRKIQILRSAELGAFYLDVKRILDEAFRELP